MAEMKTINAKLLNEAEPFLWEMNKWQYLFESAFPEMDIPPTAENAIRDRSWFTEVKRRRRLIYEFMGEAVELVTMSCGDDDHDAQLKELWLEFVRKHEGDPLP